MSYNTRRQGAAQGVGRGASPYQQTRQQAAATNQGRGVSQQSPVGGPNYQTHHPMQQGYSSQTSQSPYTSERGGYNAQQYHQQTSQQQQLAQQQQQQLAQQKQQMMKTQSQTQPNQTSQQKFQPPPPSAQPLQGILKNEVKANVAIENQDPPPPPAADGENTEGGEKKPWIRKRSPGFKINKRELRRRRNIRLRKILQPKNSVMVLNELKAGVKFTIQEQMNSPLTSMFTVTTEVDGKQFTGQGMSKMLAKQNAAEKALKTLLLEKLAQSATASEEVPKSGVQPSTQEDNGMAEAMSDDDSMSCSGDKPGDDGVPWGSLASFALFKLFSEWHSQGTPIPLTALGKVSSPPVVKPAPAVSPKKTLPENPTSRHPVMLLNQMRPGTVFNEIRREGVPPNIMFTVEVIVDGNSYTGTARNKKEAKKEAAKAALAGALQIVYDQ